MTDPTDNANDGNDGNDFNDGDEGHDADNGRPAIEVAGLHAACQELAHIVLASGAPHVSRDILETLASRFEHEALDFALLVASAGRDTTLLTRAVHYLIDAHALPLMGTNMEWFRQALACLVELAVPGIALSPKGAAFLHDVETGIAQSVQDLAG